MEFANETKSKEWDLLGNLVEVNLRNKFISERNKGKLWKMRIG